MTTPTYPAMREEMRSQVALAELAERQYGVVAVRQLCGLGYSRAAIGRLGKAGRLRPLHRGVYGVGHAALGPRGLCLAAVLACGRGAVLSHGAAAWLWGLRPRLALPVDVTVPSSGRRRADPALHHSSTLEPIEHGRLAGIPATALERTMLDVAATGSARDLNDAVERAERRGILDIGAVDALLRRRSGARGAARLRAATEIYRDAVFSRARSERLFLALVKAAGLPRPAINTWVGKFEIDAYWEKERFAVEVDGWDAHRTRGSFERDHERLEEIKLAGIDVVPITARRIEQRPGEVGRRLRLLLRRRRQELRR